MVIYSLEKAYLCASKITKMKKLKLFEIQRVK